MCVCVFGSPSKFHTVPTRTQTQQETKKKCTDYISDVFDTSGGGESAAAPQLFYIASFARRRAVSLIIIIIICDDDENVLEWSTAAADRTE